MNRREFLSAAAGAAGLVALSGCGDGFVSGVATASFPGEFDPITITVADFPQLANIGVLVAIPNRSFAAKRTGTSSFEAFSLRCTHETCIVSITNGQQFDCPCHQSRFANDGSVLRGPAQQPLPKFTTSYDPATDQLTIG